MQGQLYLQYILVWKGCSELQTQQHSSRKQALFYLSGLTELRSYSEDEPARGARSGNQVLLYCDNLKRAYGYSRYNFGTLVGVGAAAVEDTTSVAEPMAGDLEETTSLAETASGDH